MQHKVIAIDGPAGAGKSTIAKMLADILDYAYIDTGAMYRAVTLKVIENDIDILDLPGIIRLAENTDIDFIENSIFLDGKSVDAQIREERVNKNVSHIAAIPEVRRILVDMQRRIASNKNVVMDGRDVGTVIFPEAHKKFFITAAVEERARRRYNEIKGNGYDANLDDIKSQIQNRDFIDSNRSDSPLKAAEDAILIDTTGKSIEEVVQEVMSNINKNGGSANAL